MDKPIKVNQTSRLSGILKGLVHNRIAWVFLGSMLYFLGWDSIYFIFTSLVFTPSSFELSFACFLLANIFIITLFIPITIFVLIELKSPVDRIFWYTIWIIVILILIYISGFVGIQSYAVIYVQPLLFLQLQNPSFFLIITALVIFLPFGLMIRPPRLQRGLRLMSAIVLSIWGASNVICLFYTFQAAEKSFLIGGIGCATEVRWGVPLILAGIVVWLVAEILEWHSPESGEAAVKEISA